MPRAVNRIVYGSGTVVSRMAHHYNAHPVAFDACPRCQRPPGTIWEPRRSFGAMITDGPRLVERSALAVRLLVP